MNNIVDFRSGEVCPDPSAYVADEQLASIRQLHPQQNEGVFNFPETIVDGQPWVMQTKYSDGEGTSHPHRVHQLKGVELDGYRHVFWHTKALHETPETPVIFVKPGLGEIVEDGIGWKFHKQLSRELPEAEIVSHATYGVGPGAQEVGWFETFEHGLDSMAQEQFKLLQRYWGNRKVILLGTSMGTVTNNKLAVLNLEGKSSISIEGLAHYASAIVTPDHIPKDMLLHFLPAMLLDGGQEIFGRTNWRNFLGTVTMLAASKPARRDMRMMGRHAFDLAWGTPEEEIVLTTESHPTVVISGVKDPLAQFSEWERRQQSNGDLRTHPVRGGHAIVLNPLRGAAKVARSLQEAGLVSTPLKEAV